MPIACKHVHELELQEAPAGLFYPPPEPPVDRRSRRLDESAGAQGTRDCGGVPLHLAVPLRMREHRRNPHRAKLEDLTLEVEGPADQRHLQEHVAAGLREAETP